MSYFGPPSGYGRFDAGGNVSTTCGTNTKGSYVTNIASTAFDAAAVIVEMSGADTSNTTYLVDIAVGAAGSEQVIIPNLSVENCTGGNQYGIPLVFPISVPAGTRLSCRASAQSGTPTIAVYVTIIGGAFADYGTMGRVTTYGTDTANSRGALMTCPGSGAGTYAQLSASTTNPIKGFLVSLTTPAGYSGSLDYLGTLDIAVGAAGSEQLILTALPICTRPGDNAGAAVKGKVWCCTPMWIPFVPCNIPAGTRLAARLVFATGAANNICISIHGVD